MTTPRARKQKLSIGALAVLIALALSASFYIYASSRARFFSPPPAVDWSWLDYARHYLEGVIVLATPFVLAAVSLVIAPRSWFVNAFTAITMIVVPSYITLGSLEAKGPDVIGVLLFMNLVIYWICSVVLIIAALILATKTAPQAEDNPNAARTSPANPTVDSDARKGDARGSP